MYEDPLRRMLIVGVMLNLALYLEACFAAGLVLGCGLAWKLAIAAMGLTYLSYNAQQAFWRERARLWLTGLSVVLGAAAGLALLF